jgi:IS30 family transposase
MLIKYIALSVGCHRGSLYPELNRNGGQENYCPHPADKAGLARRRNGAKHKIPPERVEFIRLLIEHDWSPEQILGVLKTSGMSVSHE